MRLFIPYNTPSLKNSKVKTSKGIFPSKTVTKYLRALGIQHFSSSKKIVKEYKDPLRPNIFKKVFKDAGWVKPQESAPALHIGFHFIRKTKAQHDWINACQIIHDLMVAHDFIEDDSVKYLIPHPLKINGKWTTHDKENPGCWIELLNIK